MLRRLLSDPSAQPVAHTAAKSVTVVNDSAFSPARVKIASGKRVNWSWNTSAPHNVVFKQGKSSTAGRVVTFSRRFRGP